jgi:hypothetical protein
MPRSARNPTRLGERQYTRKEVAELATAPRVDESPSSFHGMPQGLRRPHEILCSRLFNIQHDAYRRENLAAGVRRQISKRVSAHGGTLMPSCCIALICRKVCPLPISHVGACG